MYPTANVLDRLLIAHYRFDTNDSLGVNKLSFMTDAPDWPTEPIEKMWHHYVEEHLTCNEAEKTVTHPGGSSKPKPTLSTGDHGQVMLPRNCMTHHSDCSQFLNYQKQVMWAYVERMYSESCSICSLAMG
jgi:hypothetical protein